MFVANRAMHRLFTILLYCLLCGTLTFASAQTPALIPNLSLGGGVANSNNSTVGTATFRLLYNLHTGAHEDLHEDPHEVLVGFTAGQLYNVPTQIEQFTSTSTSNIGTNGSSTITMLMATAGYQFNVPSTPLHLAVTASIGGANTAHRRLEPVMGYYNVSPEDQEPYYATTVYAASVAYNVNATIGFDLSPLFALALDAGYNWFSPTSVIVDNSAYNAPSYRANFASPGPTVTLGLRYTLPRGLRDTLPTGLRDTLHNVLLVQTILASSHPFTSTPYNEFNPGLAIHWRPKNAGITPFAEGGAYQYSVGDRAMYLGGGVLFPLGTEWIKAGIFGGGLATFDAQGAYFYPALSPRLVIDTPWASATALLIPAGEATAIGFMLGFPLF